MQIRCDRCEQPFEVDNGQPGQKVACPGCGDINVVPGPVVVGTPVSGGPRPDRAAAAGYPPANGPEVDVLFVRPAMLGAHPIRFLVLTLVLLGGIAGGVYFLAVLAPPNPAVGVACAGAALVALVFFAVWKVHTLSEGMRVTTKRTIESKGLLSKATSEVLHSDIRNIQVEQTFLDRVWNVGTLKLSSSAENEDQIEMSDMPRPEKVRQVIDLYRPL